MRGVDHSPESMTSVVLAPARVDSLAGLTRPLCAVA